MNSKINISNYKKIWNAYLSGELSETSEEMLFDFLELNPALLDELQEDNSVKLLSPDISFVKKDSLLSVNQIDTLLIAKLENEISEENNIFITNKINSVPQLKKDFQLYQKTILKAEKSIVFPDKRKLKKQTSVSLFRYASAIAAVFTLLYIAGSFIFNNVEDIGTQRAEFANLNMMIKQEKVNYNNEQITSTVQSLDTDNQTESNIISETIIEKYIPDLQLQKMPGRAISPIANNTTKINKEQILSKRHENTSSKNEELSFTIEYIPSPRENLILSTLNKLFEAGKEINVSESIQGLRDRRNELLLTSLTN